MSLDLIELRKQIDYSIFEGLSYDEIVCITENFNLEIIQNIIADLPENTCDFRGEAITQYDIFRWIKNAWDKYKKINEQEYSELLRYSDSLYGPPPANDFDDKTPEFTNLGLKAKFDKVTHVEAAIQPDLRACSADDLSEFSERLINDIDKEKSEVISMLESHAKAIKNWKGAAITSLQMENNKLRGEIEELNSCIESMKESHLQFVAEEVEKVDSFVRSLIQQCKTQFSLEREKVVSIHQVLVALGRNEEAKELEEWMKSTEKNSVININGTFNNNGGTLTGNTYKS